LLDKTQHLGYFSISRAIIGWGTKGTQGFFLQSMMTKIGKYTIQDVLGKGAMGIVYRALDPDIDRDVAVKAIHFDGVKEDSEREELIKRFMREGRAAGRLNHPNIVTIYDVGREGDLTYIVMQYVQGQSLQRILDSGRAFTVEEVHRLMIPLLRAVDYAHQNGVIHRDIKPGNVLVDTSGTPFLADFGVARTAASTLTLSGTALGTPGYISPEQLQGKVSDARADVFSLGVLLYVLLTGREPFIGAELATVMYKIVHEEAAPPSSLKPGLPEGYDVVVGRAMAKDPKDRYQSSAELAAALQSLDKGGASTLTVKVTDEAHKGPAHGRGRLVALVASLVLIILAASAAAVFVFRVFERSAPPKKASPRAVAIVPDEKPPIPTDPLADELLALKTSFEKNEFEQTARRAGEILKNDPARKDVQDLLARSEQKIREAEASRLVAEASGLMDNKDYRKAAKLLAGVLKTDPQNDEARRLFNQAETALSEIEVNLILERQRRSEEEKDLVVLLSDVASRDAAASRKEEALLLFNYYDGIKSLISNVNFQFGDRTHVQVRFLHVVTGLYKKTKEKKVLVQDVQTWSFEKKGQGWKITSFGGESAPGAD
jgi:hypothetical protein